MAVQLAISTDNKTHTLTSGVAGDILDTYLNSTHPSTTRHISIELVRNCCADGKKTYNLAPRYTFTLTATYDKNHAYTGASTNDRQARFQLGGIDVSYIKKFEVQTNADANNTSTFAWKEYTAAIATGDTGFDIYYLLNAANSTHQMRITTIDDYVYTCNVVYDWANVATAASTATVTITAYPTLPTQPTVDFTGNTIKFDPTDWGLSVTDGVYIDGVYQYNLTQVETGADKVETVNKFFNIKLKCLVTSYIANNPTNTRVGMLMSALEVADGCNLSVAQKCALYTKVIRDLILANMISTTSTLGCNCGCS